MTIKNKNKHENLQLLIMIISCDHNNVIDNI